MLNLNLKPYLRNLLIIVVVTMLCVVLYAFQTGDFAKVVSLGILIAASAFSIGGVLGFIFGLPVIKNDNKDVAYEKNNSLKEIADWITKITIGITLVELKSIIGYFQDIVLDTSTYLGVGESGIIFSSTLLIEFFFIGFTSIYIFTITDFVKYLIANEKKMSEIWEKKIDKVISKNTQIAKLPVNEILRINDEGKVKLKISEKEKKEILAMYENYLEIDDIGLLQKLGKFLVYFGEYEKAIHVFDHIYEKDERELYSKLNSAYLQSQYSENGEQNSNKILLKLIEKHKDFAPAYYNLACNYSRQYNRSQQGNQTSNQNQNDELKKLIVLNLKKAFELSPDLYQMALKDENLDDNLIEKAKP
ncbi:hypothetical protein AB1A65_02765 [Muricauda sp. ANG21]|uniref:tetratricopeptide repeat protein n=1 Tax=Allomuricauda sp. ANG21 TaxID=3042468 RepID=UPI003454AD94